MSHLFQALTERVNTWRDAGYPCGEYQAVAEIRVLPARLRELRAAVR